MSTEIENVIIIGSGPAGYTAALYASRADLNPLVVEGFVWGGLLQTTTDVENYPGFPEGVMGPEMMQKFRDQAERFGARFISHDATRVELSDDGSPHRVFVDDDEYQARAVILAMGAEHKKLGVPGEEELANSGISYCATCDAAVFRDRARPGRHRRERLRVYRGQVHADERGGSLRRRRSCRPHVPPGGHRGGHGLPGGARRRVVPARSPSGRRGALDEAGRDRGYGPEGGGPGAGRGARLR